MHLAELLRLGLCVPVGLWKGLHSSPEADTHQRITEGAHPVLVTVNYRSRCAPQLSRRTWTNSPHSHPRTAREARVHMAHREELPSLPYLVWDDMFIVTCITLYIPTVGLAFSCRIELRNGLPGARACDKKVPIKM